MVYFLTFTAPSLYGDEVTALRPARSADIDEIVDRVVRARRRHADGAEDSIDVGALRREMNDSLADISVLTNSTGLVGHLRGTILEGGSFGRALWMSPDGFSCNSAEDLLALVEGCRPSWIEAGATAAYVWAPLIDATTWEEVGFQRVHARGVRVRGGDHPADSFPEGYRARRASLDDLDIALSLDHAQTASDPQTDGLPPGPVDEEWRETLEDPDSSYVIVEYHGIAVGHAVAFPLSAHTGSAQSRLHLSGVVILPEHRGRGVGRAMVRAVLDAAAAQDDTQVEVNWDTHNEVAQNFWRTLGFRETHLRLRRVLN